MTDQHHFDDAFREWASRPPVVGGADAAHLVVARLAAGGGRRRAVRLSPARATVAVVILLLVAGTASFIHSLPSVSRTPAPGAVTRPTAVPARDVDVVLWLDDGTPVYVFLPDGN